MFKTKLRNPPYEPPITTPKKRLKPGSNTIKTLFKLYQKPIKTLLNPYEALLKPPKIYDSLIKTY